MVPTMVTLFANAKSLSHWNTFKIKLAREQFFLHTLRTITIKMINAGVKYIYSQLPINQILLNDKFLYKCKFHLEHGCNNFVEIG